MASRCGLRLPSPLVSHPAGVALPLASSAAPPSPRHLNRLSAVCNNCYPVCLPQNNKKFALNSLLLKPFTPFSVPSLPIRARVSRKVTLCKRTMSTILASLSNGAAMERKVLVSVADGCQAMEAVIPIDILRRAGTNVTVASVEDKLEISTSCEVKLVADKLVRDCEAETYDLVVIPGGMPGAVRLRDSLPLKRIVEKQVKEERFYAAICAAPAVVLQPWGLLAGKQATTHPAFVSDLEDPSFAEQRVVIDGFLVTSRGPGTAFEFALKLVETLCGQETCESVKGPMVMRKDDNDDVFRREYNLPPFGLASNKETPPKVLVPIANGSEEMEAIIVIDVLRRAGASVFVASVEGSLQIEASRKVKIVADMAIQDVQNQEFDLVVIPGGMPGAERLRDSNELTAILEEQSQKRRLTAAICAAPAVVLQSHGLLEGKKATSHPAFSSQLADQTAVEARVVMDGWLTTSRGPGTAMEFALALVERLYGVEKAAELAGNMVVFPPLVSTSV